VLRVDEHIGFLLVEVKPASTKPWVFECQPDFANATRVCLAPSNNRPGWQIIPTGLVFWPELKRVIKRQKQFCRFVDVADDHWKPYPLEPVVRRKNDVVLARRCFLVAYVYLDLLVYRVIKQLHVRLLLVDLVQRLGSAPFFLLFFAPVNPILGWLLRTEVMLYRPLCVIRHVKN